MDSLRSGALEQMNMKKLDGLYTVEDIPFPAIGQESASLAGTERNGDETGAVSQNMVRTPSQRELQAQQDEVKANIPPQTIKDFAIVMLSLMAQSRYKVVDIQMALKAYEQHQ
jgi:uncharacterized membrane protein YjdF